VANKVSGLQCIVTAAIISRRVILEPEQQVSASDAAAGLSAEMA
jgi:hypothetical protein